MAHPQYNYDTLAIEGPSASGVIEIALARPNKLNAMNDTFFEELTHVMQTIDRDTDVRVAVLHQGDCRIFSAGLDITPSADSGIASGFGSGDENHDPARKSLRMLGAIQKPQDAITSLEKCRKPIIVVVDGACIGGGVDLISACDMRYCTESAYFCVKEVEVGLAADIGTLQRLPRIVGNDAIVRELAFTARKMFAAEAVSLGLVARSYKSRIEALSEARKVAETIAGYSPLAILGTKMSLNYSRENGIQRGLEHVAQMNSTFLQSPDVVAAMMASLQKSKPSFSKL